MIKVIERRPYVPPRWRITCPQCGTVFEIDGEDWETPAYFPFSPVYDYVSCPECNCAIYENEKGVRKI